MIATQCNQDGIAFDCIHQTVATVYPARPETSQLMLERLWLADTGKRFPLNIPNNMTNMPNQARQR